MKTHASHYISRGWSPVPLKPNSKKCVDDDWLTHTYGADDFLSTQNIGLKLVNGLIDIDCDCAEAVFFADALLPRTQAIYGRPSTPRSHWLFHCVEIKEPRAFKDLIAAKLKAEAVAAGKDGDEFKVMLLEVRVQHQSMAPPSTHPNGELVRWDSDGPELAADKALLIRSVQLVATGAMIGRYYNAPGDRHDWGLALAGFLRKLSVTEHEATLLLTTAGKWVNDDKVKDRLDAIRNTYTQSEDAASTGGKRLAELVGEHGALFVQTLYKIWGNDAGGVSINKMDLMNKKHAVLFRQGGKIVVLTEEQEDGKLQIRYTSRADFSLLYPHKVQVGATPSGKPIFQPLAEAWLTHPKRRFYRGIELAPNGHNNEGYYNLWQGFSVEPKQGDWSLFKEHLMLLVKHDEEHFKYLLAWLAETVQHPERPIGIALTFKGKQGTGKSTAAKWFGHLFGAHFLHLDSEHRLLGQFNNHLHNAIVVLADEAVWAGGKQGVGALKRMITEETLAIEPKGLDVINCRNMIHMLVASNEDWVVPTNFDNRRFAVWEVSEARRNDFKFFGAVHEQLFKKGGLAGLLYDLMKHPLDVNLRAIPNTEELDRQKKHTMNSKQAWWYEQLQSGAPWVGATRLFAENEEGTREEIYELDPDVLYSAYVTALRMGDQKITPGFQTSLGRFIRTVLPFLHVVQHQGKRFWVVPSPDVCRKFFDEMTGWHEEWPSESGSGTTDIPF